MATIIISAARTTKPDRRSHDVGIALGSHSISGFITYCRSLHADDIFVPAGARWYQWISSEIIWWLESLDARSQRQVLEALESGEGIYEVEALEAGESRVAR